jgi:hypothetical protein
MSEIVDDLKVANVEVTSNLGLRLSGDAPEIKTTQTSAPLTVTAAGDLDLTSSAGDVNIHTVDLAGQIILNSNAVVVGNVDGAMGFYGGGVVAKPSAFGNTTVGDAGEGAAVLIDTTFTGGVGTEGYTIGDIVRALKNLGLLRQTVPT